MRMTTRKMSNLPSNCIYKCHGCQNTFDFAWKHCKNCDFSVVDVTNCKPYGRFAQGDPKGCAKHTFAAGAGLFAKCPVCSSNYATWINYQPKKHNSVNKP